MIAGVKKSRPRSKSVPAWHAAFLKMLPAIQRQAKAAFGYLDAEAREEAVEEVTAYAVMAFKGLWDLGKAELAYPSVLSQYGIKRVKIGRRVGTSMNVRDVSSEYCQLQKHITMRRLDRFDREAEEWQEILIEDRRCGPFDIVRTKLDFAAWLRSLPTRLRQIAKTLANGERTRDVAHPKGRPVKPQLLDEFGKHHRDRVCLCRFCPPKGVTYPLASGVVVGKGARRNLAGVHELFLDR